jgi:lysyl-tRNA synthetase, class II
MEKIFEIGKQFRNEGLSSAHYIEFTTCELYEAYASLDDLYLLTEELLHGLVMSVCRHTSIVYQGTELNFLPPYRRIEVIPFLEAKLRQSIPFEIGK